jgi:hypothetical protein
MIEILGWSWERRRVSHALVFDTVREIRAALCGEAPVETESIRQDVTPTRRCARCLRGIHAQMTPKRPTYFKARKEWTAPYTYLGWTRGLYDDLATHLLVIDEYGTRRAACGGRFLDEIHIEGMPTTYACRLCLRWMKVREE